MLLDHCGNWLHYSDSTPDVVDFLFLDFPVIRAGAQRIDAAVFE